MKALLSLIALTGVLAAQTPEFEVASIKPVQATQTAQGTQISVGLRVDGNQFRVSSMTLRDYLSLAYNLPIARIEGPDWIASERFEIVAKFPEGSKPAKDMEPMLQRLLNDRFQLKSHRVSKEFAVYAVTAAKDGVKAKRVELDEDTGAFTGGGTGSAAGISINLGRGTQFTLANNQVEIKKMPMDQLAEMFGRFMDRPVLDQTGVDGAYEMIIPLTEEDYRAMQIRSGANAGIAMPPFLMKMIESASLDSLHQGLSKFGLKLESKKAQLEVLVIDSASKTPSEN